MNSPTNFTFDDDRLTRSFLTTGYFIFALLLLTAIVALVDGRQLNGINIWWKPLKFDFSLLLHAFTLAILAQLLSRKSRNSIVMRFFAILFIASAVFENVYISVQAMRGRHSHFNFDTPAESILYALMGIGAVLLVVMPFVMGIRLALDKTEDRSGYRLGAVLGLTVGSVLTLVLAGYMSSSGSHFVDAPNASDAGGLFLLGWSKEVADLRPAHFFALHMIQILPIAGLIFDRIATSIARPLVIFVTVLSCLFTISLFLIALSGRAVWPV